MTKGNQKSIGMTVLLCGINAGGRKTFPSVGYVACGYLIGPLAKGALSQSVACSRGRRSCVGQRAADPDEESVAAPNRSNCACVALLIETCKLPRRRTASISPGHPIANLTARRTHAIFIGGHCASGSAQHNQRPEGNRTQASAMFMLCVSEMERVHAFCWQRALSN